MNTDPIADLLTRLRNASNARIRKVSVPSSKLKEELLRVMAEKKRILGYDTKEENGRRNIIIKLIPERKLFLKRVSKPGQRIYTKAADIKPVMSGYGFSIISTSQGVMTNSQAKALKLGGELICEIE
jgi:small subunit ribosomal protein S8